MQCLWVCPYVCHFMPLYLIPFKVDALCVDQMPTTQQAQQLAMMDVIYQCASLTIVALAGESSNAGLPGVSIKIPRIPQGSETIEGKKLLTVFPMLEQDMEGTKYPTRAWTMQEALLSRRRLVFSANQVHFWCNSARFCESIDESNDPANHTESYHPTKTSFQDVGDSHKIAPGAFRLKLLEPVSSTMLCCSQ